METFGLFTFTMILLLGVVTRQYLTKVLKLPYTVLMMLLGMFAGLMLRANTTALERAAAPRRGNAPGNAAN